MLAPEPVIVRPSPSPQASDIARTVSEAPRQPEEIGLEQHGDVAAVVSIRRDEGSLSGFGTKLLWVLNR